MEVLRYTQASGFEIVKDFEQELSIKLPENWWRIKSTEELLESSGLEVTFWQDFGKEPIVVTFFHLKDGNCVVEIYYTYDEIRDWILVDGEHNLMALRIALAPIIHTGLLHHIIHGSEAEVRAFRHKYDHDPEESCLDCETSSERAIRINRESK